MNTTIRAIIFDFGNVVGFFSHRRAAERLAAYAGTTPEHLLGLFFCSELEDAYESGRISTAEYLRRARQVCPFDCDDDALIEAYADIFWPNPEVCELIPRLKGRYRLLLGSNTTELHSQRYRRDFAEVLSHFDDLILSHEIGVRKPKAPFYEACHRRSGHTAAECLFVDDMAVNVDAAAACGLQGLVYAPGDDLARRLAERGVVV